MKIISVDFFKTDSGREPVKEWLKKLSREDMRTVGTDLLTVEMGWPLGMPLVRKMTNNLWEVPIDLSNGRIARVLFTVLNKRMILLHAFIKKSQSTPKQDFKIAEERNKIARS